MGAPAPAPRWGARSAAGRRQGLAPALRATGQQHPEEDDRPKDGDSGLQDSLIKQLQFEIGKKRVGVLNRSGAAVRLSADCHHRTAAATTNTN